MLSIIFLSNDKLQYLYPPYNNIPFYIGLEIGWDDVPP